jgi:hypothetical protein
VPNGANKVYTRQMQDDLQGQSGVLLWREVSLAGADLEVFFQCGDFDGAEASCL